MRHVHLLIKPASGLCNLNCRYCFYHDIVEKREQASYGLMTEDTLAAVLEKALAAASHSCTIAFQGGEPTLAGLAFFRKAVELQRRLNVNRVAGVQLHPDKRAAAGQPVGGVLPGEPFFWWGSLWTG